MYSIEQRLLEKIAAKQESENHYGKIGLGLATGGLGAFAGLGSKALKSDYLRAKAMGAGALDYGDGRILSLDEVKQLGKGTGKFARGAGIAGAGLGGYGLYKQLSKGKEKTAAYAYVLDKIAAREDGKPTHEGKVLGGLGLAGAGILARSKGKNFLNEAESLRKSGIDYDVVHKFGKDRFITPDQYQKGGKILRGLGTAGVAGGALLGGLGLYKNYQASKNDPIKMPSDATIRRQMKATQKFPYF